MRNGVTVSLQNGAERAGRIMLVDDDVENLRIVERLLRRAGYAELCCRSDPLEAEAAYADFRPDILLLDLHMPGLGGLALLARMRQRLARDLVPVLVLTGDPSPESVKQALSSGARDFVAKPFEAIELLLRVGNLLAARFDQVELRTMNDELEGRVRERTRQLADAELASLQLLARAAEFRDDDTGRHTQRVGRLSALLAETLGFNFEDVELLRIASPLHDIGKIGIPDHILLKPGPLTSAERVIMQNHAMIGADIIGTTLFPVLNAAREIALCHHERWDGRGYPRRLAGADTPRSARIVAVADAFDALAHDRPYRAGLELGTVIDLIIRDAGKHFDPEVVEAFTSLQAHTLV